MTPPVWGITLGSPGGWAVTGSGDGLKAHFLPGGEEWSGLLADAAESFHTAGLSGGAGLRRSPVPLVLLPSLTRSRVGPYSRTNAAPTPDLLQEKGEVPFRDGAELHTEMVLHGGDAFPAGRYSATCSLGLIREILEAADAVDLTLAGVTPADFSWAAAAGRCAAERAVSTCVLVLHLPDPPGEIRILVVHEGSPMAIRRLPDQVGGEALAHRLRELAGWLKEVVGARAPVLSLGSPSFRNRVRDASASVGLEDLPPSGPVAELEALPGPVAAAFAGPGPRFTPPEMVESGRARRRLQAWAAALLTLLLLALAGFLHLLDLDREIAALRVARSALRADVESALESRARLSEISSALEGLNHSRTRVPRWTSVLTGISEALPPHTHLSQARMAGDSLFLELQGPDAASALEALGGMPGLRGFRTSAPVRREVDGENGITERFSAVATLSWPEFQPGEGGGP